MRLERKWTPAQKSAIDTRDCNVLVSAAAGSGKTDVLVERIISMITDPDKNIDIDIWLLLHLQRRQQPR